MPLLLALFCFKKSSVPFFCSEPRVPQYNMNQNLAGRVFNVGFSLFLCSYHAWTALWNYCLKTWYGGLTVECLIYLYMKADPMVLPEVGAAVSVLLGFAPPSTLSAASSSKVGKSKWVIRNNCFFLFII